MLTLSALPCTSIPLISSRSPHLSVSPRRHSRNSSFYPNDAKQRSSVPALCCLVSDFDGGAESVPSLFHTEFSSIAFLLMQIEPLDNILISQGVPRSVKNSMKETISNMLGLLPSSQFAINITLVSCSLSHLLDSSVVTGYTLWNVECRTRLKNNFQLANYNLNDGDKNVLNPFHLHDYLCKSPNFEKNLRKDTLEYIESIKTEIIATRNEIKMKNEENLWIESQSCTENLLEYLRTLDHDMVLELSQPASSEVNAAIRQLIQNIMKKLFKDSSSTENTQNHGEWNVCDYSIIVSRDYMAQLLFWCMLMGYHLRGLENGLYLRCVTGLL